eukprot:TRINITY_DN31590_c0_g1_i2.p1 TRINITY_DN31590_c0_g1~~TRINITY_DN31590_c0_g1_i2.p1  ORF type:complete len:729 (+),score=133.47 TRINITY_DN31590_c0_g1_i2:197-2383(+)
MSASCPCRSAVKRIDPRAGAWSDAGDERAAAAVAAVRQRFLEHEMDILRADAQAERFLAADFKRAKQTLGGYHVIVDAAANGDFHFRQGLRKAPPVPLMNRWRTYWKAHAGTEEAKCSQPDQEAEDTTPWGATAQPWWLRPPSTPQGHTPSALSRAPHYRSHRATSTRTARPSSAPALKSRQMAAPRHDAQAEGPPEQAADRRVRCMLRGRVDMAHAGMSDVPVAGLRRIVASLVAQAVAVTERDVDVRVDHKATPSGGVWADGLDFLRDIRMRITVDKAGFAEAAVLRESLQSRSFLDGLRHASEPPEAAAGAPGDGARAAAIAILRSMATNEMDVLCQAVWQRHQWNIPELLQGADVPEQRRHHRPRAECECLRRGRAPKASEDVASSWKSTTLVSDSFSLAGVTGLSLKLELGKLWRRRRCFYSGDTSGLGIQSGWRRSSTDTAESGPARAHLYLQATGSDLPAWPFILTAGRPGEEVWIGPFGYDGRKLVTGGALCTLDELELLVATGGDVADGSLTLGIEAIGPPAVYPSRRRPTHRAVRVVEAERAAQMKIQERLGGVVNRVSRALEEHQRATAADRASSAARGSSEAAADETAPHDHGPTGETDHAPSGEAEPLAVDTLSLSNELKQYKEQMQRLASRCVAAEAAVARLEALHPTAQHGDSAAGDEGVSLSLELRLADMDGSGTTGAGPCSTAMRRQLVGPRASLLSLPTDDLEISDSVDT